MKDTDGLRFYSAMSLQRKGDERMSDIEKQLETLKRLREPFPENQISALPKPTRAQTEEVKRDFKKGVRCDLCGQWHHPQVQHLSYVGHAALTDRLLDVDPLWTWEPLATDDTGLPAIDKDGGLWIRLTVAGMTRIGYGDAPGKMGGDAMKERIGDALRNAGIRFGCALDLWHKGDLHAHENGNEAQPPAEPEKSEPAKEQITDERLTKAIERINAGEFSLDKLAAKFDLTNEQWERVEEGMKKHDEEQGQGRMK